MRVLVTGATSLLGTETAERLIRGGHEVVGLQRTASGRGWPETTGDIADRDAVARAVRGADAVVHLAARVGVVGDWESFHRVNVIGTATVLDEARRAGVTRFVHVSSPSVTHGGASPIGAAAEPADPATCRSYYTRTKAEAERLALAAAAPDFAVVAIRPHLVWGPGDRQLVARIVDRARSGRLVLVGTGAALIDTTYVDNAADALVAAVARAPDINGAVLVVSNAQPRPVREILARIVQAAGLEPPRRRVPVVIARAGGAAVERIWERLGRTDDPPMTRFAAEQLSTAHWFDQRETQRLLHWKPAVGLEEGFSRLRAWFAEHPTR